MTSRSRPPRFGALGKQSRERGVIPEDAPAVEPTPETASPSAQDRSGATITPREPQEGGEGPAPASVAPVRSARKPKHVPKPEAERGKAGRPRSSKRNDPGYAQLTVYIPVATHTESRVKQIRERKVDLSGVVAALLDGWVAGRFKV